MNSKGMFYARTKSMSVLENCSTWGRATFENMGEYYRVKKNNSTGGWGIVSSKTGEVFENKNYYVELEYRTKDVESFSYNYFISSDGNTTITRFDAINDGEWHYVKFKVWSGKHRRNTGILIGSDIRRNEGTTFDIRNLRFYTEGETEQEWFPITKMITNNKEVDYQGYLHSNNKWINFYKPEINSLISSENIYTSLNNGNTFIIDNFDKNKEIIFQCNAKYNGIFFRYNIKPNTHYTVTFRYKVLDGKLVGFGGHLDASYRDTTCYLNGVDTGYTFNNAQAVYSPDWKGFVQVVIKTPSTVDTNNRFFLQPNRSYNDDVTVKIEDFYLLEGIHLIGV